MCEMNLDKKINQPLSFYEIACICSVIGLLIIWALPGTIALRNILLVIGAISAVGVIVKTQFFSQRTWVELLPLLLFSSLFIWALIHFFYFSLNPELSLKELKSVWIRAFLASITAIGVSIALRKNHAMKPYFFISLFAISWINLVAYGWLSYEANKFILPADFVVLFVFKKIEAAFFGVIAIAIACANIVYLMAKKLDHKSIVIISFWFLGIASAIFSSIAANTKNGVAVALGLCVLLGIALLYRAIFAKGFSKLKMLLPAFFITILLIGGWKFHTQFASQGWSTLIEDVQISAQIDQHNFWRMRSEEWGKVTSEDFPKNSYGVRVAGNTYERMAYATQGALLVLQYPMGYGSINRSFVGTLNHAKVDHRLETQTHSGWIDFGLAFGIPGLLILLLTFTSIIYNGFIRGTQFGLIGVWLILGFMPFGLIAEINYKHNFEILLFFISFAAASTVLMRNKNPRVGVVS
jgi:hypothetical protein